MEDLKNTLFASVQERAALALGIIAQMPQQIANPQLIQLTDLEKATAQLQDLSAMKEDVAGIGAVVHQLYARIAGFLSIPDDQIASIEHLTETAAGLATAQMAASAPGAKPEGEGDGDAAAASGAKYREAIRREIAKTHDGVVAKGGNVFDHAGGSYFIAFYQKSSSSVKELKFSINKEVVTELAASADGHLYLVGKDGLICDVPVSALADKETSASRWDFFVSIKDEAVSAVTGNKRAYALEFDQFGVAVNGSAD